jgi:hypothetical protein
MRVDCIIIIISIFEIIDSKIYIDTNRKISKDFQNYITSRFLFCALLFSTFILLSSLVYYQRK